MVSLTCSWNEKMKFTVRSEKHEVNLDAKAPFGNESAMTPKELLLAGVAGCTGMDVTALLKKYEQKVDKFTVQADAVEEEGSYPTIFNKITLIFQLSGAIEAEKALEAVHLSQTKYCGVSAMISKVVPIYYTVEINGSQVGSGQASFNL